MHKCVQCGEDAEVKCLSTDEYYCEAHGEEAEVFDGAYEIVGHD